MFAARTVAALQRSLRIPRSVRTSAIRRPHPCDSCLLEQYVPEGQKKESSPCRFIPRTQDGATVESFFVVPAARPR